MKIRAVICCISISIGLNLIAPVIVRGDDWPQFRGRDSAGITNAKCPTNWSSGDGKEENIKWKVAIEGEGWSCPVVSQGRVYLTSAVPQSKSSEGAGDGREPQRGGDRYREDQSQTVYRFEVICLDASTGQRLWRRTAIEKQPGMKRHSSNTYATETPIVDAHHVYAYFGMNGVYCYDLQGQLVWKRDLGSYEMRAGWGTASSPVLSQDKLFIQVDNEQGSFVVALNSQSGEEIWRAPREEKSQYSSPIIWSNRERRELIVGGTTYRSYDPESGKLLWELDMQKGRSSATALAVKDDLFVGTELRNRGGADDGGGFLFAVQPGGSGNITPVGDATTSEFVKWRIDRSDIQMASPTICDGRLYLLERRTGNLHCVDAETGQTAYRKRISGARAFWASPWTDGEQVFCLDSSGTTYVIAAGSEYSLLSKNVIDEQAWSTPAVADGVIYLRTMGHLYCIAEEAN